MNANWKQQGCAVPLHKDVLKLYTGGGDELGYIPSGDSVKLLWVFF